MDNSALHALVSSLSAMDLIQKLSITALVLLSLIAGGMLIQHQMSTQGSAGKGETGKIDIKKYYEKKIARNAEIFAEVIKLQEQKKFTQAMKKLEEIRAAHPDNPQAYVYQAQIEYDQGRIAAAIHSYRTAVDQEPDYVDKKTPLFIGDTMLTLINQARGKLQREKKLKPNDRTILIAIDDLLYLQRRIAGGCE